MKSGIVSLIVLVGLILFTLLAVTIHSQSALATSRSEVEQMKKSASEVGQERNRLDNQLKIANRDLQAMQNQRDAAAKQYRDSQEEIGRLRRELADRPPQRIVQTPPVDAGALANQAPAMDPDPDELVICPWCEGDPTHPWVSCKKESGVGCAGKGYRTCFECSGRGFTTCQSCNGSGAFSKSASQSIPCASCRGTGKITCSKCGVVFVRLPTDPGAHLPPIISQGNPLATEIVPIHGHMVAVARHYGTWTRVEHAIMCPRCDGKGELQQKGTCTHCDKTGKVKRSELPLAFSSEVRHH